MCGICGIITEKEQDNRDALRRMSTALIHRGPDSYGEDCDERVNIAIRRLRIIDLISGDQPLFNEDNSIVLVANGEIYNYIELQCILQERGHNLATKNDCEVIIHLYEEYGIECFHYLRGMFAFVLYDKKQKQVLIARDQIGEKPLYYNINGNKVIFSSEMKSILKEGSIPFVFDADAVNLYFHYQYVPEPRTPINGVYKLPAAHYMFIDLSTWHISINKYWSINSIQPIFDDPVKVIQNELQVIGDLLVRSDVPVGVALSGGIDSSAVASLVASHSSKSVHAFSVGYVGDHACDETEDARQFADDIGIAFHAEYVNTEDVVSFFPKLNYFRDDPIADISGHGYYAVSHAAHEMNVPVLLFGHGGDEFFWGYQWVIDAAKKSHLKNLLHETHYATLFRSLQNIGQWKRIIRDVLMDAYNGTLIHSIQASFYSACHNDQLIFMDSIEDFRSAHYTGCNYYPREFKEKYKPELPYDIFRECLPWTNIDIITTKLIYETYLLENGIAQGDRLSMASSVEGRIPFVDRVLIEKVIGLRRAHSDLHLPPKYWLKAAVKPLVPEYILNRKKRGFTPPIHEWESELFDSYGHTLKDGELVRQGILSHRGGNILSKGEHPRGVVSPISFKALVLEQWAQNIGGEFH